jgi:phosphoribosyl-ATP pyrophosphohydrolase
MAFSLSDLEAIVAARGGADPGQSWTAKLLSAGPSKVAKKFGEEAVEAVIAAVEGDRDALVAESADVLFHLLVLLKARGIAVGDVMAELERRTAQSGIAEKAARSAS